MKKLPYSVNLTGFSVIFIDQSVMFTKKQWIELKYLLKLQKSFTVTDTVTVNTTVTDAFTPSNYKLVKFLALQNFHLLEKFNSGM